MTRKLISILVVLVLLLSIGAAATASNSRGSDGGIKFDPAGGQGIHNPECCPCKGRDSNFEGKCVTPGTRCKCHTPHDPADPNNPEKKCCPCYGQAPAGNCTNDPCKCHPRREIEKKLGSMDIDFGQHELTTSAKTYYSLSQARGHDPARPAVTPVTVNGTPSSNNSPLRAAGFLVESTAATWEIQLKISEFTRVSDSTTALTGFTLKLVPGLFADAAVGTRQGTTTWTGGAQGVCSIAGNQPTLLAPTLNVNVAAKVATGKPGISGGNFAGELIVPAAQGAAAKDGELKAVLTWSYITPAT